MKYDDFLAYAERCKKIWKEFKDSFSDPAIQSFLKQSFPVLSCPKGQIAFGGLDARAIARDSPYSFVQNKASAVLIERIRRLEALKKDAYDRNKEDQLRAEKKIAEFNFERLEFEKHRLEVRFPSLKIDLIQQIKASPFVDQDGTGKGRVTIRVVLSAR